MQPSSQPASAAAPAVDRALLDMLTRYNTWGNGLFHDFLRGVPEAAVTQVRPGLGGILGVMGHIYVVGLIWQAHLTGREHGFKSRRLEEALPLAELHRRQLQVDRWYNEFAASESEERLAREIRFTFIGGGEGVMRADEMVLHVVNHSTYHRGFVAQMLYDSGIQPPATDLPVYLRHVRAERGHAPS